MAQSDSLGAMGWMRIGALTLGTVFFATAAVIIPGIMTYLSEDFGRSAGDIGLLIPVYTFPLAILIPVVTMLTRAWSRRLVLSVGLLVGIAGVILMAVAPTFEVALVARFISALGGSAFIPVSTEVAALISPLRVRGRAVATVLAGINVATAFGAPIGTLLASAIGWRLGLVGVAGLGVLSLLGVLVVLSKVPPIPQLSLGERLGALKDRFTSLVLLAGFLLLAGNYGAYVFFAFVNDRATGDEPGQLALLFATYGVVSLIGTVFGGWISDRVDPRRVFRIALAALVVAFIAVPFVTVTIPGSLAAIVLWGAGAWCAMIALQAYLARVSPQGIAWNTSANFLGMSLSGMIGTVVLGFVEAYYLTIALLPLLIAAFVVFQIGTRRAPDPHDRTS